VTRLSGDLVEKERIKAVIPSELMQQIYDRVMLSNTEDQVVETAGFSNVKIAPGAKVIDSVLMPGAIVEEGATVTRALVAENIRIGKNAKVGNKKSEEILLVAKNVKGED
jgi:ADP-glucose pyrophosphorylase